MRQTPTPALQAKFDKLMRNGSYEAAAGLLSSFPHLAPNATQHALLLQRSARYAQSLRGQQPAPVRHRLFDLHHSLLCFLGNISRAACADSAAWLAPGSCPVRRPQTLPAFQPELLKPKRTRRTMAATLHVLLGGATPTQYGLAAQTPAASAVPSAAPTAAPHAPHHQAPQRHTHSAVAHRSQVALAEPHAIDCLTGEQHSAGVGSTCAVLSCPMLCCAVMSHAVLCCAVPCCAFCVITDVHGT